MTQATNKAFLIKMYLEYSVDAVFSYNYILREVQVVARISMILFSEVRDPSQYRGTGSTPLFSGCLSLFLSFLAQSLNTSCIAAVLYFLSCR